jgi:MoaA/NifB/PqqE/SkfB family radical SAM enzyme
MNVVRLGNAVLNSRLGDPLLTASSALIYVDPLRTLLVRALDRRLAARGEHEDAIGQQRTLIYRAVLYTVDRLVERRTLSPQVTRTIIRLWARTLFVPAARRQATFQFRQQRGCLPPWFLVLSPGHACNLNCPGCYASSGAEGARLPWSVLDRIVGEAKTLWGVPLFVFSGGEPLVYRSQGKDLLDIVEKHSDCLFLMFTNGTLIERTTAARLARLGNLTPALSVEGWRARTDARRGAGTYDRVLQAMSLLREEGVPFGLSITATRDNCQEILSDPFLDFFFGQQGAFYAFLFQYTPIGRDPTWKWMPTPKQRAVFWRRSWEAIARKRVFLLDFWNHGPLVEGCIAAGRERGYLYIDWNGRVMPCVFMPCAGADVHEIYARGGTLNDVWEAPLFRAIRQWQRDYGYGRPDLTQASNWMSPCPFRDHHHAFREWVARYGTQAGSADDEAALVDETYAERMLAHARENAPFSQEIWKQTYLRGTGSGKALPAWNWGREDPAPR